MRWAAAGLVKGVKRTTSWPSARTAWTPRRAGAGRAAEGVAELLEEVVAEVAEGREPIAWSTRQPVTTAAIAQLAARPTNPERRSARAMAELKSTFQPYSQAR